MESGKGLSRVRAWVKARPCKEAALAEAAQAADLTARYSSRRLPARQEQRPRVEEAWLCAGMRLPVLARGCSAPSGRMPRLPQVRQGEQPAITHRPTGLGVACAVTHRLLRERVHSARSIRTTLQQRPALGRELKQAVRLVPANQPPSSFNRWPPDTVPAAGSGPHKLCTGWRAAWAERA